MAILVNMMEKQLSIQILNKIFEQKPNNGTIHYDGKCYYCGHETEISITKTSSGYGLLGGVIFKSNPDEFLLECDHCYNNIDNTLKNL